MVLKTTTSDADERRPVIKSAEIYINNKKENLRLNIIRNVKELSTIRVSSVKDPSYKIASKTTNRKKNHL